MALSPARAVALRILQLIESERLAAATALNRGLPAELKAADRALVTQLVYGVTRWRGQLDWLIDTVAAAGRHRPKELVRHILRLATYELVHLTSIPPAASCHQAVELTRRRQPRAAGFVNALCRRLASLDIERAWPDQQRDPLRYLAVRWSHPEWLVTRWLPRFGFSATEALLAANNANPPLTVRVNRLRTNRASMLQDLQEADIEAVRTELSPDGLHVRTTPGGIVHLPGFRHGRFLVQDESSQLVAHVVAPQRGERILDACSAPGGKTTHLAELMDDHGTVLAFDIAADRLKRVEDNCRRLGIRCVRAEKRDARELGSAQLGVFDRVLLDAPCTGLGVVRRRPDARWRKRATDVAQLAKLQAQLLTEVASLVRPGGILVYSTCSTEPEETIEQVKGFLQAHPEFSGDPVASLFPPQARARLLTDGLLDHEQFTLQLQPFHYGTDGFFIARLRRQTLH